MKIVSIEEFRKWIMDQPDDRKVNMDQNVNDSHEFCGCFMVQYAIDTNLIPEENRKSAWGCGFAEWEKSDFDLVNDPHLENEELHLHARFEDHTSLYNVVPPMGSINVFDCETFGEAKELLNFHESLKNRTES